MSNLSLRPFRYLSTVTRSSNQGSFDGFRRERLQRFATFDSGSKITNGKENYGVLPSGNLEATGAVGGDFSAVYPRWIRRAASLESSTLVNLYIERKTCILKLKS